MAAATTIKEIKSNGPGGKTKFQAQVWHKGIFYTSKTFDVRTLAVTFKEESLKQILKGELKPASTRKEERLAVKALEQPMSHWAAEYAKCPDAQHGKSRMAEYTLVGRLLAHKTLKDFHGKAGEKLLRQLTHEWRAGRVSKSKKPMPAGAPPAKPLANNTLRLRLTALDRLLRFAKDELPAGTGYELPATGDVFKFTLPPAYSNPRKRMPTDSEYLQIIEHFGVDSDFSHFLRVIEETGCRLSEVRSAKGSDVTFFHAGGQVVGGYLTLGEHKTDEDVGEREIPLSLFAAQVLDARVQRHGKHELFASLGTTDKVCKAFDERCRALSISGLLIKDFRRAFINRNKFRVPHVDMVNIVGQSPLLDARKTTDAERDVVSTVGHTSVKTTAGYARPDMERLGHVFTQSSRWPAICALMQTAPCRAEADTAEPVSELLLQLSNTLAQLSRAGVTTVVTSHSTSPS